MNMGVESVSSESVSIVRGGLCDGRDRIGDPLVTSESIENRDIGRPSESRENRSGCGTGLGGGGGGVSMSAAEINGAGTGLSVS